MEERCRINMVKHVVKCQQEDRNYVFGCVFLGCGPNYVQRKIRVKLMLLMRIHNEK